jgi:hypothetical protein
MDNLLSSLGRIFNFNQRGKMITIAVVNQSTMVSNAQASLMCSAIQVQLDLHFLPAWGLKAASISFYADATKVPGYAWLVSLLDNSTVAGALGYHEEDSDKPDAFIFAQPVLSNGGAVLAFDASNPTQYTVSATLSHEVMEMIGDRFAGTFCQGPQIKEGNLYCFEMADAVEQLSYGISVSGSVVSVSNFLFPSWFNPEAVSPQNLPYDYLNQLTAPFTMAAGGYMIMGTLGNEGQVTAKTIFGEKVPQWKKDYIKGEFYRR